MTCDEMFNLCHEGANVNGLFNGALNTAVRISRNQLEDGAGISVEGTTDAVTVEFNVLRNGTGSFAGGPAVNVTTSHVTHATVRGNEAIP